LSALKRLIRRIMKLKLVILSVIIVTSLTAFIFRANVTTEPEITLSPGNPQNPFLIGAMTDYWDLPHHSYYDALGLNLAHVYDGDTIGLYPGNTNRHTPWGGLFADQLLDAVPVGSLQWAIGDINPHNNSKFMWMRPKIEWLCYGQSSIYKAYQDNPDLWFYAFNTTDGDIQIDSLAGNNEHVLHCGIPTQQPGTLALARLKANTEECRRATDGGNEWEGDSECDWFVKPRIRIPLNVPDQTDICRIHVIQDNLTDKIPPVTIKAINFKNNQGQYDGGYMEEFYLDPPGYPARGVKFPGDLGSSWCFSARGTCTSDPQGCNHSDIQVEWLGNCDMWIDYVKVENDVADGLMNPNSSNYTRYNQWISDEVTAVNLPPYVYNFYIELFEFNEIPCMAYVNHKIDSISGGKIGLMADQPFLISDVALRISD